MLSRSLISLRSLLRFFIERTLNQTISTFPVMEQFLKPFSRALEYLKQPNEELLDNLHPEERAVVKDILGIEQDL